MKYFYLMVYFIIMSMVSFILVELPFYPHLLDISNVHEIKFVIKFILYTLTNRYFIYNNTIIFIQLCCDLMI